MKYEAAPSRAINAEDAAEMPPNVKEDQSGVERCREPNESAYLEPVITHEVKLQIARALYRMMVGKYPDRLITLCDQELQLARSDRPETMPPLS
jgi:hypothetical protein